MRRRVVFGSALAAAAALVACDGGPAAPDGVRLSTDRAAYAAGEAVAVTVTNARPAGLTFDLCVYAAERREGSGWRVAARFPVNGLCAGPESFLAPGGTSTFRVALPPDLAAGEYRWRFRNIGDRATSPFDVR